MRRAYTFSDVLIEPKYSDVSSRESVVLDTKIGPLELTLPVISSHMDTITGPKMVHAMCYNGATACLHRSHKDINDLLNDYNSITVPSASFIVSVGVGGESYRRFSELYKDGARIFCVDIAHGHSIAMQDMLSAMRIHALEPIYIIAGNIATSKGAYDIVSWGADCVKVGIGPGSVCLTRKNGIGVPQLYALENIRRELDSCAPYAKIIADGGMSTVGDIAKALKYADAVMLGGMLAGTKETPGKVYTNDKGEFYKIYRGSASGEHKTDIGKDNRFVEGMTKQVLFRGSVKHVLRQIKEGLQSAFSYVGAHSLKEFQDKCEFIEISSGGKVESKI